MKTLASIFAFFLAGHLVFAQSPFEGILEFTTYTKDSKEESEVKWMTKDGNNKLEISGVMQGSNYGMTILLRIGDPLMYLFGGEGEDKVMFTRQQDSVVSTLNFENVSVTKTDGKKNFAGYNCYLVKIESAEEITECWISDAINMGVENFPPSLRSKGVLGVLRSNGIKGIPLEVVSRDAGGEKSFSFSITKVTAQTLAASLFSVPTGYSDGEEWIRKSIKVE